MDHSGLYLTASTPAAAALSAGCTIAAAMSVSRGDVANAVALVRPPGHHACSGTPMGFCVYNNVAVAAATILADMSLGVKRVLIVDWDVHHGNGTQELFESDPRVLYFSIHRYDGGRFYPGGPGGSAASVGVGAGKGTTVNVAFNTERKGDADYLAAFHRVLLPLASEFRPDLVLVSAGFDAAAGDPFGGYALTPEGYAHLTHMCKSLAGGKVVVVLEGGYNTEVLGDCAAAVTATLLGDQVPVLPGRTMASRGTAESIAATLAAQRATGVWRCLGNCRRDESGEDSGASWRARGAASLPDAGDSEDTIPDDDLARLFPGFAPEPLRSTSA